MTISILGIDIGKSSCSVVGVDDKGAVTVRRTMRRQTLIDFVSKIPTCIIAMEACCGDHHLGRLFVSKVTNDRMLPNAHKRKNRPLDRSGYGFMFELVAGARNQRFLRLVERAIPKLAA